MSNVFRFRPRNGSRVVFRGKQRPSRKHRITITVLDQNFPEDVRALAQRRVVDAAGFGALRGFTDALARRSGEHSFMASRGRTATFVRRVEFLVRHRQIAVKIDGIALRNCGLVRVA